jgi:hypothetical protein
MRLSVADTLLLINGPALERCDAGCTSRRLANALSLGRRCWQVLIDHCRKPRTRSGLRTQGARIKQLQVPHDLCDVSC